MRAIADAIGFNLVVISPTIALVLTALILLFFTITIESNEKVKQVIIFSGVVTTCLLYTSPSPRDRQKSRMPSSA